MRGRSERGFSFIEILVVMGIIAVLSGLVLVAVQIVGRKKPELESETRVNKLKGAADHLKINSGGQFPPIALTGIEQMLGGGVSIKKVPNHTNEGIESLLQAIYWPGAGIDPELGDGELSNTDEDELDKAVGRGKPLYEVKDGYQNPIAYFPFTEYAAAWEKPHDYVLGDGSVVQVRPWKSETGFANPMSCQIFSFGPDGQPNTEDDIKSWTD
jgi:prepilin-type N-terminal cleavage/methylation domain-containing protein